VTAPLAWLTPQWPVAPNVRAAFTHRAGGVSAAPFDTLNLGTQVGDLPAHLSENRRRVQAALDLPAEPLWLSQVHGTAVFEPHSRTDAAAAPADALIVRSPGIVAAIQVADCLPVLLASADGRNIAAAHAGWRGLSAGILETTVARLGVAPQALSAWLGPAIGPAHFEVGDEVRAAFMRHDAAAERAFTANARARWQCDLAELARQRLRTLGVREVHGGGWCTFADRERFFSYRRDGQCGRMAALVWLT
jgi:YfiH family protein